MLLVCAALGSAVLDLVDFAVEDITGMKLWMKWKGEGSDLITESILTSCKDRLRAAFSLQPDLNPKTLCKRHLNQQITPKLRPNYLLFGPLAGRG